MNSSMTSDKSLYPGIDPRLHDLADKKGYEIRSSVNPETNKQSYWLECKSESHVSSLLGDDLTDYLFKSIDPYELVSIGGKTKPIQRPAFTGTTLDTDNLPISYVNAFQKVTAQFTDPVKGNIDLPKLSASLGIQGEHIQRIYTRLTPLFNHLVSTFCDHS